MDNLSWLLLSKKLSGIATDEELAQLEERMAEFPEWQNTVQQVTGIWEMKHYDRGQEADFAAHVSRMQKSGHDTEIFSESNRLLMQPSRKVKTIWMKVSLLAASVVFAFACWIIFQPKMKTLAISKALPSNKSVIQTNSGHRRKMVLPDGTQVWLNAESKLEYNEGYGKNNRDVTLSGEAFFDVVKNVEMPFTIQTNKIHIKVTGTAFNVKAYPGDKTSETSLIRGRVEVTINERPDEKIILKPNEKLVVRDEMLRATEAIPEKKLAREPLIQIGYINFLGKDSAAIETSWVYDRLVFEDESLADITKKLERWYGVHISIADPQLADQHLTYTIRKENINQALANMRYALRFNYSINGNNITITR